MAAHVRPIAFAVALVLGCQVNAKVKASGSSDEGFSETGEASASSSPAATPASSESAPVASASASGVAPAPAPPTSDACPLTCYEARGPERASLTAEEQGQVRGALEPILGRMRSCIGVAEWQRFGSPVMNLRFASDGTLADVGYDPAYGVMSSCLYDAEHSHAPGLVLPGRKVVRCSERCGRVAAPRTRRPRRR